MLPQILRNSVFRPVIKQRNLTFLQSTRLAQELKENADLCLQSLERSEFLFYHKGRPLLRAQSHTPSPTWLSHPVSSLLNPDLANQSVLLGVSEGGTPQFATLLPSQADFTSIEAGPWGFFDTILIMNHLTPKIIRNHQLRSVLRGQYSCLEAILICKYLNRRIFELVLGCHAFASTILSLG